MTKQEARRWVYEWIRGSLVAGLVEDEAASLRPSDKLRVEEATRGVISEMERRAGYGEEPT